jgi:hypothetical protein
MKYFVILLFLALINACCQTDIQTQKNTHLETKVNDSLKKTWKIQVNPGSPSDTIDVTEEHENKQVFRFWKYKDRFHFQNRTSFHIQDYEDLDFETTFKPLTYDEQDEVFGDEDILKPVFFSTLFDSTRIVVTQRYGYYTSLNVMTYNSKGKIVGNEVLAVKSAQNAVFFETYSTIIDNNSLKRYYIYGVYKDKKGNYFDENNIIRQDSMIEQLTFLEEGKIRIDTLRRLKK